MIGCCELAGTLVLAIIVAFGASPDRAASGIRSIPVPRPT